MNFYDLPCEIITKIGYILNSQDIHQLMTVCKILNKYIGDINWEDYFRNKLINDETLIKFNTMVSTIKDLNILELFSEYVDGNYIRFDILIGFETNYNYIGITSFNKCVISKYNKPRRFLVNISNEIFYKLVMDFIVTYSVKEISIFKNYSRIKTISC